MKVGVREIPWFRLTLLLTMLYALLTLLTSLSRIDLLNVRLILHLIYA